MSSKAERETFAQDPAAFLEKAIKQYVATSPANRLPHFGDAAIFDEPLVGFASGDDPIFVQYKKIIGEFHITPREALDNHLRDKGIESNSRPVGVISWVMPFNKESRLTMWRETEVPSLRWNHCRWQGQNFMNKLAVHVVSLLEKMEHQAVAPEFAGFYNVFDRSEGRISNWSHRHIAYAAGLGTFSLSDGFITERGIAMRCGSAVTDIAFASKPPPYASHTANCLFFQGKSCRRCIERCPAGAITEKGHDKNKCREFMTVTQPAKLKELHREGNYIGVYLGCALCQTKVPCEDRIPPRT